MPVPLSIEPIQCQCTNPAPIGKRPIIKKDSIGSGLAIASRKKWDTLPCQIFPIRWFVLVLTANLHYSLFDIRVGRLVHMFPAQLRWQALFQNGMSSIRQSWGHNGHWALDLHSTEGCVKHGSWYWNLFIETWGGTGSVFSTQWEAFMVKAMNLGRGSATWVHTDTER